MTLDRLSVLSARRAYRFRVDDIRLSMLSTNDVNNALRDAFTFQEVSVAVPPAVFGEVPPTMPPGLVCTLGEVRTSRGPIPIRALFFDSTRMVIDVAGPSSGIDVVKQALMDVLSRQQAPDGHPVVGQPIGTSDQSDLTFHADLPFELGLPTHVLSAVSKRAPAAALVLAIIVRPNDGDIFPSSPETSFILEPRAGSALSDHHWFSSAPLDTDAHVAYLEDLQTALLSLQRP